jgi:hypothetical protein
MFTNWQKYMDKAQNATYQNADGSANSDQRNLTDFRVTDNNWLAAEAKYKNQQAAVTQAQTALNSAWLSLTATFANDCSAHIWQSYWIIITNWFSFNSSTKYQWN